MFNELKNDFMNKLVENFTGGHNVKEILSDYAKECYEKASDNVINYINGIIN